MTGFTVRDGRLWRDGERFVAVGVDYHPSGAGCRIWTDWDPAAIERDLREIADAGFSVVRFFVFWRDFEPEPGRLLPEALARLRHTVECAASAGLACVVSLFTIWMNGQLLDPAWRRGRSLFLDADMLTRQEEFAAAVGRELRGTTALLAIDLGDEIGNVSPDPAPSAADVAAWHRRLATVLRRELPGVLVTQANDVSGVLGQSVFGPANSAALDMISVHGFPTWSPGSIESTAAYKATSLAPFLVRFAAAYGVPFVDELGAYGVDEEVAAHYLRAAAASSLANGAAGVLAWCWQDIASVVEPYSRHPSERFVGLRHLDGTAKPALTALRKVAGAARELSDVRRGRARIALYVPERTRAGGASYLDPEPGTLATFYAHLLLKRAHLDADIVSGDLDGYRLVVCPSATMLTMTDLERLRRHLDSGGFLFCSMGDRLHGFPGEDIAGARLVDFSLLPDGKTGFRWGADAWPVDWDAGRAPAVTVRTTTGTCLGRFGDGTPALVLNEVGEGRVLFCAAPFERQLDRPGRLTSGNAEHLYRRVAELAGIPADVDCADPDVEIVPDGTDRPRRAVVINHGTAPARVDLVWRTGRQHVRVPVSVGAKDWCVVDRPATAG
ncbi:beta-galactosidase trimerization domain-containing protein [Streptomyces olivaceoviridis]|uniref:beta-galactosidase trimerization domain-containing protein n=1 Tax=Streptomyces olivaceoviridis TaxID=1921 RepID=UPI0036F7171C